MPDTALSPRNNMIYKQKITAFVMEFTAEGEARWNEMMIKCTIIAVPSNVMKSDMVPNKRGHLSGIEVKFLAVWCEGEGWVINRSF